MQYNTTQYDKSSVWYTAIWYFEVQPNTTQLTMIQGKTTSCTMILPAQCVGRPGCAVQGRTIFARSRSIWRTMQCNIRYDVAPSTCYYSILVLRNACALLLVRCCQVPFNMIMSGKHVRNTITIVCATCRHIAHDTTSSTNIKRIKHSPKCRSSWGRLGRNRLRQKVQVFIKYHKALDTRGGVGVSSRICVILLLAGLTPRSQKTRSPPPPPTNTSEPWKWAEGWCISRLRPPRS